MQREMSGLDSEKCSSGLIQMQKLVAGNVQYVSLRVVLIMLKLLLNLHFLVGN